MTAATPGASREARVRHVALASLTIAALLVLGACIPRDSSSVTLVHEETVDEFGGTVELDFFRNPAYDCGLTGNFTFLVIEPLDDPGAEAPLWIYLHGGGAGYFDDQGTYRGVLTQDENSYNHEETFGLLWGLHVQARAGDGNGLPRDNTLGRRISEGYRLMVPSMCDHDFYSGLGTPYPNNPVGGEVNGLQATMAAIDYVAANYPTTHVFVHGTSAGGVGAHSVANSFATEGSPLTGMVADSYIITPRQDVLFDAFTGAPGFPYLAGYVHQATVDKVQLFADPQLPAHPEARVSSGFDAVPMLFVGGDADPFCGGNQDPVAEAALAELDNCNWVYDGLRQAIAGQPGSPHQLVLVEGAGHVPTNQIGPVNDVVDAFLAGILAGDPPEWAG